MKNEEFKKDVKNEAKLENAASHELSDEEIENAAGGIEILDDFLEACGDFWLSMFRPKHEEKEPPKPDSIGKDEFGFVTMR